MPRTSADLAEFASINLHYAQAEITAIGDRESILRALDHIRQAEACLKIVMAEYDIPPDEAEAGAEAAQTPERSNNPAFLGLSNNSALGACRRAR